MLSRVILARCYTDVRCCTVHDGVYHTPLGRFFPNSTARQPRGCQYRTMRLRKALGEMLPTLTFLAPAIFQLSRYRARNIRPGGGDDERCGDDKHCRMRVVLLLRWLRIPQCFGQKEVHTRRVSTREERAQVFSR